MRVNLKVILFFLLFMGFNTYTMKRKASSDKNKNKRYKLEDKNHKFDFRIPLRNEYILDIKKGKKTIEGRLNKGIFKRIKQNSIIQFFSNKNTISVRVENIKYYNDFSEMLSTENIGKLLPKMNDVEDISEAVNLYRSFPGYKEGERKYGILALHLSILE